jgi:hypothetical protein
MLCDLMRLRALSLALALLLLLTQQFGLQHMLSHALRAPTADRALLADGALPAGAPLTTDPTPAALSDEVPGADRLCQVCLVLSAFVAACLPALLAWRARPQRWHLSAASRRQAPHLRPGAPYLARAPPAGLALT